MLRVGDGSCWSQLRSHLSWQLRFGRRLQHTVVWQRLRPIYMPLTVTKGVRNQPSRQLVGWISGARLSHSVRKPGCWVTAPAAPNRCIRLSRLLDRLHMARLCPTRTISFLRLLFRSVWRAALYYSLCGPCIFQCLSAVVSQARWGRRSLYRTSSDRFSIVTCRPSHRECCIAWLWDCLEALCSER